MTSSPSAVPVNRIDLGDSLTRYSHWSNPDCIISDGAYGIGGFPGDPKTPVGLADWYRPHVEAWTAAASSSTVLWFWNTEVGWANTHSLLVEHGWVYVQLVVWDKGISHVAGNVNGDTIRRFPVATEVAGLYVREPVIRAIEAGSDMTVQDWLRKEWVRSGRPLSEANEACGVKNAATRKWLTADAAWYMPSLENLNKMRSWLELHGEPAGKPYLELPEAFVEGGSWERLRNVWNHEHGVTNVWQENPVRGASRLKGLDGKTLHANQKPLSLLERQIKATTAVGGVVWEPFAGTGSASVAAKRLNRSSFGAEHNESYWEVATRRLRETSVQG